MIKLNKENVKDFQPETEKDYKRYEMDHPQIKNKINSIYEKVNFSSPGDRKKAIEVGVGGAVGGALVGAGGAMVASAGAKWLRKRKCAKLYPDNPKQQLRCRDYK